MKTLLAASNTTHPRDKFVSVVCELQLGAKQPYQHPLPPLLAPVFLPSLSAAGLDKPTAGSPFPKHHTRPNAHTHTERRETSTRGEQRREGALSGMLPVRFLTVRWSDWQVFWWRASDASGRDAYNEQRWRSLVADQAAGRGRAAREARETRGQGRLPVGVGAEKGRMNVRVSSGISSVGSEGLEEIARRRSEQSEKINTIARCEAGQKRSWSWTNFRGFMVRLTYWTDPYLLSVFVSVDSISSALRDGSTLSTPSRKRVQLCIFVTFVSQPVESWKKLHL